MLHGRDATLRALRASLGDAIVGRGGVVLVSGEAGIGKSAIASAIGEQAEACGAAVTWGRAWEFADAPPYFPVRPCLKTLGVEIGEAFALWEDVLGALARVERPAVWIVEDLHAADLGTLDLITFLAQPLRAMRVLIIATAREADPRVTDRMLQRLARIARDGIELALEPLKDAEIAAVTQEVLGRVPGPAALRQLVELTGGNPLFVVECARAFRASGGSTPGTLGALPPTVRQVVLDRVELLPAATREMLASGAVVGREFSAATVARMANALPARVIDSLLAALRAGVVRETKPGHFIFSHTLVRDAIEDALDAHARAELHGRACDALAILAETSEILVERARHALAAGAADALALATRAAELLEREGAFDRAFELYIRIDAARTVGFVPPADAATTLHVARVARAAGRGEASRRLCEHVIGAARASGDLELLARGALLHATDVRPGIVDRAQVALLEEARGVIDHSPALGCRVLARLATAVVPSPDPRLPIGLARAALANARGLGDDATIIDVLELGGWGLYEAELDERIAWATELLDRSVRSGALAKGLTAYTWLVFHRIEAGDFAAFERDVAAMLAIADELGHPRDRWRALLLASCIAINAGRFAESDRFVTEVAQLAPLIDDPALARNLELHQLMRALVQRRDDEARRLLGELDRILDGTYNTQLFTPIMRAFALARLGDADGTRAELAKFGLPPTITVEIALTVGEACALAGTNDDRRRLRSVLAAAPRRDVTLGPLSFTYEGTTTRVIGLLDAALGELASAEAHLRTALELARSRGHAPWIAQLAFELAEVLRRAGRGDEARPLADESARIARDLGMPGLGVAVTDGHIDTLRMSRAGDVWTLTRGNASVVVKDVRGLQLLARLVERAGQEIHVLALASDEGSVPDGDAGDVLDDRARKAYRRRLAELAEQLSNAEDRGDAERAAGIERERATLVAELARASGLGGRARKASSATERARINVQKRLKEAIARASEADPELGRFLDRAVRTGTYCCFRP